MAQCHALQYFLQSTSPFGRAEEKQQQDLKAKSTGTINSKPSAPPLCTTTRMARLSLRDGFKCVERSVVVTASSVGLDRSQQLSSRYKASHTRQQPYSCINNRRILAIAPEGYTPRFNSVLRGHPLREDTVHFRTLY